MPTKNLPHLSDNLHRVREALMRLSSRPTCRTALAFAISDIDRLGSAARLNGHSGVLNIAQRMGDALRSMPPDKRPVEALILTHVHTLLSQAIAAASASRP